MKFLVKLFDTNTSAADGSRIPRSICEEYINSEDYQIIIRDRIAIGGETHKDRRLDQQYQGVVGMDDQVLINDNATHYITKLYFKSSTDSMLYAEAELFNPDLFSGLRRDKIKNVQGMILSGVRMPISVVIQALWSPNNECKKIIRIKGFDFTQNNSFPNAGFVEVIDDHSDTETYSTKAFSNTKDLRDCKVVTKAFSTFVEIIPRDSLFSKLLADNKDRYDYKDIINCYSINSIQGKIASSRKGRFFSKVELESIQTTYDKLGSKDDLSDVLLELGKESEFEEIIKVINNLTNSDEREALKKLVKSDARKLLNILSLVPSDDPNYKQLISTQLDQFLRANPETATFSTINSVNDRVMMISYPRYSIIDRLIRVYKQYYEINKESMSELRVKFLLQLFIQDFNLLIKRVEDYLYQGISLTTLYALGRYSDQIALDGKQLSIIYRKIMILERNLGFIPQEKYIQWIDSIKLFYSDLIGYVFGIHNIDELTLVNKI